jgi:hypothetical protein
MHAGGVRSQASGPGLCGEIFGCGSAAPRSSFHLTKGKFRRENYHLREEIFAALFRNGPTRAG